MASDSFTNSDGVTLVTHGGGNWVWIGVGDASNSVTILTNALTIGADKFTGYYYLNSTTDKSQAILSANLTQGHRHSPTVRTSASNYGYSIYFSSGSGGNWTDLTLARNNTFLTVFTTLSYAQNVPHTMYISASGTGATVTLTARIDGNLIGTYDDTSASRLVSGYSGIELYTNATVGSPPYIDEWTDGASAADLDRWNPGIVQPHRRIVEVVPY